MTTITDPNEIERLQFEDDLRHQHLKEQKDKRDYSFSLDGSMELCSNCGNPINGMRHCPNCDY